MSLKSPLPRLPIVFFFVWLTSIFLFLIVLIINLLANLSSVKSYADLVSKIIIGDVTVGVLAFLGIWISWLVQVFLFPKKRSQNELKSITNQPSVRSIETKGNPVNQVLLILVVILVIGLAFTVGRQTLLLGDSAGKVNSVATPVPVPTISQPTSTPAPQKQALEASDPIITCLINQECGGGSRQMKKSECDKSTCCTFDQRCGGPKIVTTAECTNSYCCYLNDGTAKLLTSKSACDNYYSNNTPNIPDNNVTNGYVPPTYYPCTLYYPALHSYSTYNSLYQTKAECDAAQASLNQGSQTIQYQYTAPTQKTPQITKSQCQSSVNDKYRSLMVVKYGCSYPCPDTGDCGDTSVCAVIWHQAQNEMSSCNQYP